jgi:hypothetical protein
MLALQHLKLVVVTLKLPAEVIGICSIQNTVLPGESCRNSIIGPHIYSISSYGSVVVIFEAVPLLTPVGRLLNLTPY